MALTKNTKVERVGEPGTDLGGGGVLLASSFPPPWDPLDKYEIQTMTIYEEQRIEKRTISKASFTDKYISELDIYVHRYLLHCRNYKISSED